MTITFEPVSAFPAGTLASLLRDAYSFDARYGLFFGADWEEADRFFYTHLQIADRCGFITVCGETPIGFVSWDPRGLPDTVILGHNCIATRYKGKGLGRTQLREALRRIRQTGCRRITVTTNEQLIPARRNYEAAGFCLSGLRTDPTKPAFIGNLMDYELIP